MDHNISIIIPTFNRPEQLNELLYSLTFQHCQNFEIIIINNNGLCVKEITERYPLDITYINHPENHFVKTRNIAIERAKFDWIMFIDDDDLVHPTHIQKMIDNISDGSFYYSDAEILTYTSANHKRVIHDQIPFTYLFSAPLMTEFNMVILTGALFKKSLFEHIGPLDVDAYNYWDWDFVLRAMNVCTIQRIPSPTVFYFVSKEGKNTSDSSAGNKRQPYLDYLCKKHGIGPLSTENFLTMLKSPRFEKFFDPQDSVYNGINFWEVP